MNNRKKIMIGIIVIIIIIIIITCILLILNFNKNSVPNENYSTDNASKAYIAPIVRDSKLQVVKSRNDYYIAQTCANKFYLFYIGIFDTENSITNIGIESSGKNSVKDENINAVYNMLDEEYIKSREITKDNIANKLTKVSDSFIDINNMYISEKSENISIYIVSGNLIDKKTANLTNFQIMIKLDLRNRTFKVLLQDYINEKYKDLKLGQEIDISVPENIESIGNNIFESKMPSDEEYILDLFDKYKKQMLYNKELVYNNHIEAEYKKKKFNTLTEFETYTKNNISNIITAKLEKYQKTINDNYTQYVCIDQKGKYYIFRETAPMNYTVILDTYTIDLPEFTEQYNKASDEDKVAMNIQKFFDAIEDGDYKYAYNKLDSTYKNNNFKTQADFEKYVKQNFFEQNKLSANNAEKQGDVYLYKVNISDETGKNAKTITKNFVMQLKEGTDFVMSFEV